MYGFRCKISEREKEHLNSYLLSFVKCKTSSLNLLSGTKIYLKYATLDVNRHTSKTQILLNISDFMTNDHQKKLKSCPNL